MVLLILFALLAGAGTALSPCVLPVLPAVLSAGVTGGRRRPLGLAVGLALSFTFATIALVYVIDALGLPNGFLRKLAIAVLLVFGLSLLIPRFGDRIEAWLSRLGASPRSIDGDGFGSGLLLGGSLGLVYAPCAGPILAAVIAVSASQPFTLGKLAVAFAYGVGSGAGVYLLAVGGRRLTGGLRRTRSWVQPAMGALMVAVAVILLANGDIKFENAIANHLPAALVNPTKSIEESGRAGEEIASLHGSHGAVAGGGAQADRGSPLPVLGAAPEFTGNQRWFSTPGDRPLTLAGLRGRVVLVDFWTYTCINCIRTFPSLKALDAKYRSKGLTIVGVHSPEFPFEKDAGNVASAVKQYGIRYPVAQDNELATWTAYGNQYWPADYLIDSRGRVRYVHFGEGAYARTERAVRSLLAEAGPANLGGSTKPKVDYPSKELTTPETYLGALRADGFVNGPIRVGSRNYGPLPPQMPPNGLAYGGRWNIGAEKATARRGAGLALNFTARRVYLVLGSAGGTRPVRVLLDGKPLSDAMAGTDVHGGVVRVGAHRLYDLVSLSAVQSHMLELEFAPGVSGYAFTFG